MNKICLQCGNEMKNARSNKKFCSTKCKWDYWKERHPNTVITIPDKYNDK